MKAIVFEQFNTFPARKEVPEPTPGSGGVPLKVAGAGCCHSDVSVVQDCTPETWSRAKPPIILWHETTGWVERAVPRCHGLQEG